MLEPDGSAGRSSQATSESDAALRQQIQIDDITSLRATLGSWKK